MMINQWIYGRPGFQTPIFVVKLAIWKPKIFDHRTRLARHRRPQTEWVDSRSLWGTRWNTWESMKNPQQQTVWGQSHENIGALLVLYWYYYVNWKFSRSNRTPRCWENCQNHRRHSPSCRPGVKLSCVWAHTILPLLNICENSRWMTQAD